MRATHLHRLLPLLGMSFVGACSTSAAPPLTADGSTDNAVDAPGDQTPPEVAVETGGEVDQEAGSETGTDVVPAPTCATALVGDAAFGVVLEGDGSFVSRLPLAQKPPRPAHLAVAAYFPTGRRAGGTVILAMPGMYPRRGIFLTEPAVLNAMGGIDGDPGLSIHDELQAGFHGALVGPDQGLVGTGFHDFAFGTDVGDGTEAPVVLCPGGPVPAAQLIGDDGTFVPNLPLYFIPTAPVDEEQLALLKVAAGGTEVPTTAAIRFGLTFQGGKAVLLSPVAAFPPNRAITITTGGAHDVIGRPLALTNVPTPLVTSAVATDLTFTTAPPDGALATTSGAATVAAGQLVVGVAGTRLDAHVLLSLGDPGNTATHVRVRAGVDCKSPFGSNVPLSATAAVVGANGEVTSIPLVCGPVADHDVARPATGPLWLSVALVPQRSHPQSLPFPAGNAVRIDEITFQ